MEPLSPRSANVPPRTRVTMKKTRTQAESRPQDKVVNKDKIEDKWRPASVIAEPGPDPEVYHTGRKLGKGGFAVCFEGTLKRTGQVFAMKVVKSYVEQRKQLEKFQTELQIHAKMRHPNIVEFYRAFAFDEHTYVVLELCPNGSLMEMVKSRSCLSLPEVRRYMIQLCGGIKYMHKRAVIHRDLKMGNLFLDSKMDLKIGDFGLAAIVVSEKERRQTLCGTPNYIAPEILDKKSSGGHDHKVDTWAVGIICYAMLTGGPPFASKTQPEIYAKLKQLEYNWKTDGLNYIPTQAKDLVAACLNLTANARPEMDDLVEHDFFKMGVIAEELNSACRSATPEWLESADPRGDRVKPGYGVGHDIICASCGVGKMATGVSRPSIGENVSKSALSEVELENKQGLAPIVPLPAGFIYKQFTAAKDDWTVARKYPVTSTKVRSRKNPPASGILDLANLANALPEVPARVTVPTRLPVQSFAAQQRQAALPSRAVSQSQAPPREGSDPIEVQTNPEVQTSAKPERKYLRERPLRSASGMSTRSNSTREAVSSKVALTKSSTVGGELGRTLTAQLKSSTNDVVPELPRAKTIATLGRSTSARKLLKEGSDSSSSTKSSSSSPPSSVVDPKEIRTTETLPTIETQLKANSLPSSVKSSSIIDAKSRLLDPEEHTSLLRSSRPRDVLTSLRLFRESLSDPNSVSQNRVRRPTSAPPIVEKWVDYTNKYGIAYILSDHTVGCIFNSSESAGRPASCIVVRDGRSHYIQRAQQSSSVEARQLLPANGFPVEFYENDLDGLRKSILPSTHFDRELQSSGDKVSSNINTVYDKEKLKLVLLCDKFGRYMAKTLSTDDLESEDTLQAAKPTASQKFLKFYQRLGNVGVWGFSSSSSTASSTESVAFQFNFPDHTKIVLYENGSLLDLYHLQAADAMQLAREGALSSRALERRRMTTMPVATALNPGGSNLRTMERDILISNQVTQKLAWIKDVIEVWIREGGLGRMGTADGSIYWKGLQEGGKNKLVWVTVGRLGGDKPAVSSTMAA